MDALFFAANLLFLSTYLVNDLLRSRALSGLGTILLVAYFGLMPEPMLSVVGWNLVFLALTVLQIGRLLLARRGRAGSLPA
jgi:hypothetical protein